jgi:hypothetical protein
MPSKEVERTNEQAEDMLYDIWEEYFPDVPRKNLVLVHFGRYSKRRLGSIKWANKNTRIKYLLKEKLDDYKAQDDERISVITLTKYYQDPDVPENVVRMTIAHELVHYAHGFHSPLPKLYKHPHRGNVVNKELITRGLEKELNEAEEWLKDNWNKFVRNHKR